MEFREIENTRYVIDRVFAGERTTSMLIEQRLLENKNRAPALTDSSNVMYNSTGGSFRQKEGR